METEKTGETPPIEEHVVGGPVPAAYPDEFRVPCNAVRIAHDRNTSTEPGTVSRDYGLVTRDVQTDADDRVVMRLTVGVVPSDWFDETRAVWVDGHVILSPACFTGPESRDTGAGTGRERHTCEVCRSNGFTRTITMHTDRDRDRDRIGKREDSTGAGESRVSIPVVYTDPDPVVDAAVQTSAVLDDVHSMTK